RRPRNQLLAADPVHLFQWTPNLPTTQPPSVARMRGLAFCFWEAPMMRSTTSESTLVERLRQHASVTPERTAIRFIPAASAPTDLTFGALDAAATRLAGLLRSRTQPGDRILMFYPPGLDFVVAFFGVLYPCAVAVRLVPPRRQRAL